MNIVRGFLSATELAMLRTLGEFKHGWVTGRQATGYQNLPLRPAFSSHTLVQRALAMIGPPYEDYWDAYVIRYLDGNFIPDHTDAAQQGRRHRRINAVIALPASGGELAIDDVVVDLAVGDAVVFEPDREIHRVSPVVGTRLVFSVGAWI